MRNYVKEQEMLWLDCNHKMLLQASLEDLDRLRACLDRYATVV